MILDRKKGPDIKKITHLEIPEVSKTTLDNGVNIWEVNLGTQNLIQVEILFKGGRINEDKKGVARATARLMKEGTKSYSGAEIAENIDFCGANLGSGASLDYSYVKVLSLNRFFDKVLPIVEEVLFYPEFPEFELQKYKDNSIQRLQIEAAKSELVAYKVLTEKLYGTNHPYGYNSSETIYNSINRQDLIDYHKTAFVAENCNVIVSGKVTPEIKKSIVALFSKMNSNNSLLQYTAPKPLDSFHQINRDAADKLQTAIKIGTRVFDRKHLDFSDLFIANTILGGYFGSRLMTKLREEKGYTYNIYSSLDMMIYDGYFNISTEVGNEYLEDTLKGIYDEIEIMKNVKVQKTELDMVKNYLSGNFLNMVDGPFKVGGMAKVIALNDLSFDYYKNLMSRIHTISSDDIQEISQRYFTKENMVEVVVG